MKLIIIGFWGGYPKVNEASTGYLLEHDGFRLMIDFGSGVLAKMQNFVQPEELDALILSHYHPDHVADIGVLQHARLIQGFLGKKSSQLPIYGHAQDQHEFAKLTYKNITKGVAYNPDQKLEAGPFTISFIPAVHPVPCYAMRIEAGGKSLVYTADTSYKDDFISFASGADLLLSECNFYGNQDGKGAGHMNSYDNGKFAKAAGVKQLVLTHLPHYGELEQLVTEASSIFKGSITLAKEGLEITI
ncbi:MBL fold metallo-hydrolase [Mesobacillus subterraneus]|uniref:MBL fold metallo-hydrolase n=1 Tax=Mesobacillus subterraneus TaxID=285983 RepID=A0A427TXN5_9BACI|nr:MBL fold metallo-hydrolase [Mesobacillus subterraneus]RSD29297.1 MBL fold metallo-hydrolase [Mesobacillus subterraneus]